ncbi:MAG: helix-turn-helix transcriptional regulator [Prevotella sp.]|nr:helix-turn-helix transcriptional regulator [Prevotella sp.]
MSNGKIGDRIKERREYLKMSQDDLAKKLGYKSRSSINKIERDASGLPQSKIVAIANALNTTPAYIMGWESDKPETSKKIDAATDVLIRMETDKQYSELVLTLYKMDNDKLLAVKAMLDSLKLFSSAERK